MVATSLNIQTGPYDRSSRCRASRDSHHIDGVSIPYGEQLRNRKQLVEKEAAIEGLRGEVAKAEQSTAIVQA